MRLIEIKVRELLVDELVGGKKLEVIKHPRGLSEVESVSSLKIILKDDYLSTRIDLEGIYEILTNFIIQQFSNFLTVTPK